MAKTCLLAALLFLTFAGRPAGAAEFFVAADGKADGDGSRGRPWDLPTALAHPPVVRPGDTLWLRGGTYKGAFTSSLTGAPDAPITVRQYPGERARIDVDYHIMVFGPHVRFWGFEVFRSDPRRVGEWTDEYDRFMGFNALAADLKFINLVVHDVAVGFGLWERAPDAEVYGCLTYYNGWEGPTRGLGMGLYIQNRAGTKQITDVISFNNFGPGMKSYTQEGAADDVHFDGVITFNNGDVLSEERGFDGPDLLIGAGQPMKRNSVKNCFIRGVLDLTYGDALKTDLTITDNLIGRVTMGYWEKIVVENNMFVSPPGAIFWSPGHTDMDMSTWRWDRNQYHWGGPVPGTPWGDQKVPFVLRNSRFNDDYNMLDFAGWQALTGLDRNSTFTQGRPADPRVMVRPNKYEPGRANIAIYNPGSLDVVEVDVSAAGLEPGQAYRVQDAQNFFGPPVAAGTYEGRTLRLRLAGLSEVAPYVGQGQPGNEILTPPAHTGKEFNAFVLLPGDAEPRP